MGDPLDAARTLAERIRFSGDTLDRSEGNQGATDAFRAILLRNELEVAAEVTPDLHAQLELVCERLSIPRNHVRAFVYASPALAADCFAGGASSCVIRFSSGLVDLLDHEEFAFVCGHELGHFLLGHGISRSKVGHESIEFFIQRRAQEISVDRIGLVACRSLDIAIRALMKTISGLTNEHLRFDVGTFLRQLRESERILSLHSGSASHPSILVRCRALLWFSLSDFFDKGGSGPSEQMTELDERIASDLDRYVDGPLKALIQEAKDEVAMWMAVSEVTDQGSFTKDDQGKFEEMFGADMLRKLKEFLADTPRSEVHGAVFAKLRRSRVHLEQLIPSSFVSEVERLQERISSHFS